MDGLPRVLCSIFAFDTQGLALHEAGINHM